MTQTRKSTEIEQRILDTANYILKTNATVRKAASHAGVSKSTVHTDMTKRLPLVFRSLYWEVNKVFQKNKAERHLRGGEATRRKYLS